LTATTRRRRTPEEAEGEILDAAERLLRTARLDDLTVTRVMAGTTLTRNAFYVYFRDRYDLVARLVERLRAGADAGLAAFAAPGNDLEAAGREALAAAARLYQQHGELLRALADAAQHDPGAERAWSEFIEPSHEAATARVRAEAASGRISGIDPDRTVKALIAMNRACFFEQLVGQPDADVDALVTTLHAIWTRTLTGTP
jgi:AcrR family transcriptional regulator